LFGLSTWITTSESSISSLEKSTSAYATPRLEEYGEASLTCILPTSIMAVQFKDGVIIGADSRTTTGSYIARIPIPVNHEREPNAE
jgi:20S proteasome alpha/beta subunit